MHPEFYSVNKINAFLSVTEITGTDEYHVINLRYHY